jgi:hypothetical protein
VIRPFAISGALLLLLLSSACGSAGPTKTVTRSIELDDAKSVNVDLNMAAGELNVRGGAAHLVDGSFTFNVPEWEPAIDYRRDGENGSLVIRQPNGPGALRNTKNEWDIRLSDAVPVSLMTTVGAGEGTMTLGSLNLHSVQVEAGAGEFTLDLRGTPKRSYDVRVNASVGQASIHLPKSVAIVATATAGVGGVNVSGLEKQGSTWVNAGHEQDPVVIHVDVKGGVGQIELSAE